MRSGLERSLANTLKVRKVKFQYETMKLPYTIDHYYRPDFILENGTILEAKGYLRRGETTKMKAVKAAHPDLKICFVFQVPDKKVPGLKQTHGEWAERNGFPWCGIDNIPDEWLK